VMKDVLRRAVQCARRGRAVPQSARMKDSRWCVSTRRSGDDSASCATSVWRRKWKSKAKFESTSSYLVSSAWFQAVSTSV
jgi:hypothetical protein